MGTIYTFQKDHYFAVHHCEFITYATDDGETLGDIVYRWSASSETTMFDSIPEAMNKYLFKPFPSNPRQWIYDINRFLIISEVLSSKVCMSYKDPAKSPTKTDLRRFEQGNQELYIVQCSMALQEVIISDVSAESAKAEGITPLSLY